MNGAMFVMIVAGTVFALANGDVSRVTAAVFSAGDEAIETVISLSGGFMLFGGLVGILEKAGVVEVLVRILRRPLQLLLGKAVKQEAMAAVTLNLSANMLGMGNAATPMGIKAAQLLTDQGEKIANSALCMFMVINATSVQLYPTSVVALRAASGSSMPEAIVWPALVSSMVSTGVGMVLCKACERIFKR